VKLELQEERPEASSRESAMMRCVMGTVIDE
jgi:hypothetical protein